MNRDEYYAPLPPRRTRRKRRRFPLYYGLIALVLFLSTGVLYAQEDVFGGKDVSPADTLNESKDHSVFAAKPDPDEDIEINDEKTDRPKKDDRDGKREKRNKADAGKSRSGKKHANKKSAPSDSKGEKSGSTCSVKERNKTTPTVSREGERPAPAASAPKTAPDSLSAFEREVVDLVNQERAKRGLKPLIADPELSKVARVKSEDMRDNGYFSHNSPTYGSPFDMMKKFGIQYRTAGENIAAGYPSPEAVVEGWMNSSGHRANILNSQFTHIGVGYAKGGDYGHYWTQQFIAK